MAKGNHIPHPQSQQTAVHHEHSGRRIALITGSSSGFGLLIALVLARQGWQVIATMRDLSRRQELEQQAMQEGLQAQIDYVRLDC